MGTSQGLSKCRTSANSILDLNPLYALRGIDVIDFPQFKDVKCKTKLVPAEDSRDDGAMKTLDAGGRTRRLCLFKPKAVKKGKKRPLLIFFPGSGGDADTIYSSARIRQKAETFPLSTQGDGYMFISVQPRNLHWPYFPYAIGTQMEGTKNDYLYRDFKKNVDIKFVDKLIDKFVAKKEVDPQRIFVSGWSNGGQFAQMVPTGSKDENGRTMLTIL